MKNLLKIIIIYGICLASTFMDLNSQNISIQGFYDTNKRTFETIDSNYWIDQFHNGVARISKNGYVGLIDTSGKIICPLKYDRIYDFYGSVARFGLNGKYGLLSKDGKELLPASLKNINDFNEDLAIIQFFNNKYGVINTKGKIIRSGQYDYLSDFKDEAATYKKKNIIGILTKNQQEIILVPDIKQAGAIISFRYGIYVLGQDGFSVDNQVIGIDRPINIVPIEQVNKLYQFSQGLAIHFKQNKDSFKLGFVNHSGDFVISPVYEWATPFKHGLSLVRKENKWGAIDLSGKLVIPYIYDQIQIPKKDRLIVSLNGKFGLIDGKNNILIALEHDNMAFLFHELYAIYNKEGIPHDSGYYAKLSTKMGLWGVVNEKGQKIIDTRYDRIIPSNDFGIAQVIYGVRPVSKDNNGFEMMERYFVDTGFIDYKPQLSISYDLDSYIPPSLARLEDMIFEASEGSFFYFKNDVRVNLRPAHQVIGPIHNGLLLVEDKSRALIYPNSGIFQQRKYDHPIGVINYQNKVIIPLKFQDIIYTGFKDIFLVETSGKWGTWHLTKETQKEPSFESIKPAHSGFIVAKGGKYGFLDLTGKEIIPFIYDNMEVLPCGTLSVKSGKNQYLITKKGVKI